MHSKTRATTKGATFFRKCLFPNTAAGRNHSTAASHPEISGAKCEVGIVSPLAIRTSNFEENLQASLWLPLLLLRGLRRRINKIKFGRRFLSSRGGAAAPFGTSRVVAVNLAAATFH